MAQFPIDQFSAIPTPFYYYDTELLQETIQTVVRESKAAGGDKFKVHYAVKANANPAVLKAVADASLGADCVSGGEILAALQAGIPAEKIVFAGVGKTDAEILTALESGIGAFNVESLPELENISAIASRMNRTANVAIRVNPDIDAHTHHYITTGLQENKFGIDLRQLPDLLSRLPRFSNINFVGLHFHIGSQITDLTPYAILSQRINSLVTDLTAKGITIKSINVGGGLGIDYDNPDGNPIAPFKEYFTIFAENLRLPQGTEVHFELGRAIVAQCGSLISRVLYVKEGIGKRFAILDAGMTDLIRPALYQAYHKIDNITSPSAPDETYDIVGPICESSDVFGADRCLPRLHRGDMVAIRSAGAYGEVMASQYNLRPLPPTVLSHNPLA